MTVASTVTKKWKLNTLVFLFLVVLVYVLSFTVTFDEFYLSFKQPYRIPSDVIFVPLEGKKKLAIHCNNGRLGNQMGTYATLIGLAYMNGRTPYSKACNLDHLRKYFNLSSQYISDKETERFMVHSIGSFLRLEDWYLPNKNIYIKGYLYPLSFTFFDDVRDILRKEFVFLPNYIDFAQDFLHQHKKNGTKHTYVGIHVRRTDYITHQLKFFQARVVDMEYFNTSMDYFRSKYKDVLFVAASDDKTWLRQNLVFDDVIISPDGISPGHDMALLTQCNHTIMSYGSFGFWGAYLSQGEIVYFADYIHPNSTYLRDEMPYNVTYLPSWKGISTTSPEFWKNFNITE